MKDIVKNISIALAICLSISATGFVSNEMHNRNINLFSIVSEVASVAAEDFSKTVFTSKPTGPIVYRSFWFN